MRVFSGEIRYSDGTSTDISTLASGSTVDSDAVKTEHLLNGSVQVSFSGAVASGGALELYGSNDPDVQPGQVAGSPGQPVNWTAVGSSSTAVSFGAGGGLVAIEVSQINYRWLKLRFTSGGTNAGLLSGRWHVKGAH